MLDDKLRLLETIKQTWGKRGTTGFVKQGHYGNDAETLARYPSADIHLDHIRYLIDYNLALFFKG